MSVVRFRPWPPFDSCVTAAASPQCIVIAGPNGAGKTTFARSYLPNAAGVVHFINADFIAGGLSPLDPRLAAVAAGRLVLVERRFVRGWQNFEQAYRPLADAWAVYDNSGRIPRLKERGP